METIETNKEYKLSLNVILERIGHQSELFMDSRYKLHLEGVHLDLTAKQFELIKNGINEKRK